MRRALLAVTGLAASTTVLVVLKGAPGAGQAAQDVPVAQAPATPGEPARGAAPSPTAAARGAAPSAKPTAGRTPSGTRSTTAAPRSTTAAPRTTRAAPPKSTTHTVFGPEISYEYGTATVQITVTGNKIVDAVGYLPEGGQSAQRSSKVNAAYSGTQGDVVDLQSANLDTVATATATSNAYQRSLQGAIDRAF